MERGKKVRRAARILLAVVMAVMAAGGLWSLREMTAEDLSRLAPGNLWTAALWFWALYALKALSMVFPLPVLQLGAGLLFPLPAALGVNAVGALAGGAVGYWVGRFEGAYRVAELLVRYPKAREILGLRQERELIFVCLIRAVGVVPVDVASILLGSMRVSFPVYLLGTLLGMSPGIAAATVMGASITQPGSPAFWGALGANTLMIAIAMLLYRRIAAKRKGERKEGGAEGR